MLKFSPANAKTKALKDIFPKIKGKVYSLDLPSGYTCPGANKCKSFAVLNSDTNRTTIKDGPCCEYRCFSASQEALLPATRKARWHNLNELKKAKTIFAMAGLIIQSLPNDVGIIRIHVSGDFFSTEYLIAWLFVSSVCPDIQFYCYTKSLLQLKEAIQKYKLPTRGLSRGILSDNFHITACIGGKYDSMITELNMRTAKVVYSEKEAKDLGLKIDHTDQYALTTGSNFALLIHGVQPAQTMAAKAVQKLKKKYTN